MKVKELIVELQKLNPEAIVVTGNDGEYYESNQISLMKAYSFSHKGNTFIRLFCDHVAPLYLKNGTLLEDHPGGVYIVQNEE